jgi:hypothetical protein
VDRNKTVTSCNEPRHAQFFGNPLKTLSFDEIEIMKELLEGKRDFSHTSVANSQCRDKNVEMLRSLASNLV